MLIGCQETFIVIIIIINGALLNISNKTLYSIFFIFFFTVTLYISLIYNLYNSLNFFNISEVFNFTFYQLNVNYFHDFLFLPCVCVRVRVCVCVCVRVRACVWERDINTIILSPNFEWLYIILISHVCICPDLLFCKLLQITVIFSIRPLYVLIVLCWCMWMLPTGTRSPSLCVFCLKDSTY